MTTNPTGHNSASARRPYRRGAISTEYVVIIVLLAVAAILGFMLFGQVSRDKIRTVSDKVGGTRGTATTAPGTDTSGLATGDGSGGTAAAMSGRGDTVTGAKDPNATGTGTGSSQEEAALGGGKRKLGEVDEPVAAPTSDPNAPSASGVSSAAEVYGQKANTPTVYEEPRNPHAWAFPYLAFVAMAVFMLLIYYLFMAPKPGKN